MAYVELEDLTGMIETIVFPELYKNNMMFIEEEAELILKGRLDLKEDSVSLIATDIIPLKEARENLSQQLKVHIYLPGMENEKIERLRNIVEQYRGDSTLTFVLKKPEFVADLQAAPTFRVRPSRDFVFATGTASWPRLRQWQTLRRAIEIK